MRSINTLRSNKYCILIAFEDVGCGRSLENYYKALLSSTKIIPVIAYTNENSYKSAPTWITNKEYRQINKVDSTYEDSLIEKDNYRSYSEYFYECQNYIVYLRNKYGENTIWVVDESLPELEPYMGKYTVQVYHGELFDIGASYFRYPNFKCFKNYSLILAYGELLKHRTIDRASLKPNDPRIKIIGRVLDDSLHNNSFPREKVLTEFMLNPKQKTVLYAPSWESRKIWPFGDRDIDPNCYQDKIELKKLCDFCQKNKLNLIIRPHTISINHYRMDIPISETIKSYSNVYFNDNTDYKIEGPNKSLSASDIMITDLSSIATDFLSLNRPVIFMYPDQNDGLWYKLPTFEHVSQFGYTVRNFNEFYQVLTKLISKPESRSTIIRRKKISEFCIAFSDGKAGHRFQTEIEKLANNQSIVDFMTPKYFVDYIRFKLRSLTN